MKKFREGKAEMQLPSFMRAYQEFDQINRLTGELQTLIKKLSEKVNRAIAEKTLEADGLIADIFNRTDILPASKQVYEAAQMRVALGNPPGKFGSIGDAINWTILLAEVPDGEDVHIISEDGDYFSILNEKAANPFLVEEWQKAKGSKVHVYRSLSEFMTEHFDGVAFSFDKNKEAFIDDLYEGGSYEACHSIIAKLETFPYFSKREVERILGAAIENGQFGDISRDIDVVDFLMRIAVPKMASLSDRQHVELLEKVIAQKKLRDDDDDWLKI